MASSTLANFSTKNAIFLAFGEILEYFVVKF